MYKNLKWLRLVPDAPGKGGTKTGFHSFQVQPLNETRQVNGFHIYRGRWRKDYLSQSVSSTTGQPGLFSVKAVHAYTYPSLTNPAATQNLTLLGHHVGGGFSYYWDFTNNTVRESHDPLSIAATFLNIQGRCFAADGAREGIIFDDRTAAIHTQKNQTLGIGTPTQPLAITTSGAFTTQGSGAVSNANLSGVGAGFVHGGTLAPNYINSPDANSGLGTLLIGDIVTPFLLNTYAPFRAGAPMAGVAIGANAQSSNTTPFTATGTVSIANNSSIVTLTGWTWPITNAYAGLRINFAGYSFVILETGANAADAFDLDGVALVLTNVQALIAGVYTGPTIAAPGVPYTITGVRVTMAAPSTALMGNSGASSFGYSQETACNLVLVGVEATRGGLRINLGNQSFDSTLDAAKPNFTYQPGPRYAYAWYDPETGHMSNVSPMTEISAPLLTINPAGTALDRLTPYFEINAGMMSYPTGVDATRFSHIVFFRTLASGGSTLYPIGSLQPYIGKVHPGASSTRGSWNPFFRGWMGIPSDYVYDPTATTAPQYWYDFSSDEDLILTGGFRAPQFTNEKPMVLLQGGLTEPAKVAHQAYWDRRLWVVATQEPDKIAFSCDEAQCPLGVPVESFPPTNYLRIPSVDGQIVGLKTVGDMLLVTTNRWAYTIAGNNESNYRLLRVSTRMAGVGVYQMSELTSDVEGQQSIVYFLGRDKIVYEWVPGGAVRPISAPVQDILNTKIATLTDYQTARVHCVSAWARRIVIVTYQPSDGSKEFLIFDVENRVWTTNVADDGTYNPAATTMPPAAMTTIYGLNPPVNEIFTRMNNAQTAVIIRSWIRDDGQAQPLPYSTIATFPLDFDGTKKRKELVMVNIHISNGVAGTWTVSVYPNESPTLGGTSTLTAYTDDPLYSVYGPTPSPVDASTAADLVVLTAQFTADGTGVLETAHPLVGYRFPVNLTFIPVPSVLPGGLYYYPCELYAIDIGYIDWEEPAEGDP